MTGVWAKRPEPHGTDGIRGLPCCGCRHMSCIATGKRTQPWRYYCDLKRKPVVPGEIGYCEEREVDR